MKRLCYFSQHRKTEQNKPFINYQTELAVFSEAKNWMFIETLRESIKSPTVQKIVLSSQKWRQSHSLKQSQKLMWDSFSIFQKLPATQMLSGSTMVSQQKAYPRADVIFARKTTYRNHDIVLTRSALSHWSCGVGVAQPCQHQQNIKIANLLQQCNYKSVQLSKCTNGMFTLHVFYLCVRLCVSHSSRVSLA